MTGSGDSISLRTCCGYYLAVFCFFVGIILVIVGYVHPVECQKKACSNYGSGRILKDATEAETRSHLENCIITGFIFLGISIVLCLITYFMLKPKHQYVETRQDDVLLAVTDKTTEKPNSAIQADVKQDSGILNSLRITLSLDVQLHRRKHV